MESLWDELDALAEEPANSLWDELDALAKEPTNTMGLGEPGEQVIEEVPGTVSSEDVTATMTIPEMEQSKTQVKENLDYPLQTIAGIRQSVTLPLAKIVEDGLSKIGIDIGNESSKDLAKINKYIEAYNKRHPDQVIHPATIGNIASQIAVPMAKTVKGVAATEAILYALHGIGQREDYDDVILDATIGAVFGAGVMKLFERLTRNLGPLSYEAKLLIDKHPELDETSILKTLEGVPKADQAYALSNIVEDDFVDFTAKAVKPDSKDKLLLKQQLAGRTKIIQNTLGDVDKQVIEAKNIYSEMIDEISIKAPDEFKFDSMVPKLDGLIKRYDKTPSKALSIVNNMKADLDAGNGVMNTRTALQFRQDLNYLLNRAKRYEEKALLKSMKDGVDTFLTKNLDEPTLAMVDTAITNYSRAMNNRDFITILSKYTKQKSTDWVGLQKALKAEKLSSPEVDNAIEIVKEFSEKFKNDKQLRSAVRVRGQAEDPGGMLGIMSYAINAVRDTVIPFGKRHKELKIQEAILKSIRNAKNPVDVFKQMEINKVPPKMRKGLQKALLIEYKPGVAKKAGDIETPPTEPGKVEGAAPEVTLSDRTTEILQKALQDNYSEAVKETVDNKLKAVRYDKKLKSVATKLKAGKKEDNIELIVDTIKLEAEELIKEIERSTGVKLPTKEAEKLIKYRFDDIMKDCK